MPEEEAAALSCLLADCNVCDDDVVMNGLNVWGSGKASRMFFDDDDDDDDGAMKSKYFVVTIVFFITIPVMIMKRKSYIHELLAIS